MAIFYAINWFLLVYAHGEFFHYNIPFLPNLIDLLRAKSDFGQKYRLVFISIMYFSPFLIICLPSRFVGRIAKETFVKESTGKLMVWEKLKKDLKNKGAKLRFTKQTSLKSKIITEDLYYCRDE